MKFAKASRSPNSFRFLLILSKNIIRVLCKISFLDLNKGATSHDHFVHAWSIKEENIYQDVNKLWELSF